MNFSPTRDAAWCEAYRQSEIARLEEQAYNPERMLDRRDLTALGFEAIARRWSKRNPQTAERMKVLFRIRLIEEKTLDECGVVLNVSCQRVRQMEAQLITTIREHVRRQGVI